MAGSRQCNHNKNIGVGPWAAATLVTDQVVLLVLQCSGLTTEAADSELKMIKVMHIYSPGQGHSCYVWL